MEASGPNSLKHAYLLMMMMMNESCPTQLVNYVQTGLVSRTPFVSLLDVDVLLKCEQ